MRVNEFLIALDTYIQCKIAAPTRKIDDGVVHTGGLILCTSQIAESSTFQYQERKDNTNGPASAWWASISEPLT